MDTSLSSSLLWSRAVEDFQLTTIRAAVAEDKLHYDGGKGKKCYSIVEPAAIYSTHGFNNNVVNFISL
jgi:hypothetical protein